MLPSQSLTPMHATTQPPPQTSIWDQNPYLRVSCLGLSKCAPWPSSTTRKLARNAVPSPILDPLRRKFQGQGPVICVAKKSSRIFAQVENPCSSTVDSLCPNWPSLPPRPSILSPSKGQSYGSYPSVVCTPTCPEVTCSLPVQLYSCLVRSSGQGLVLILPSPVPHTEPAPWSQFRSF